VQLLRTSVRPHSKGRSLICSKAAAASRMLCCRHRLAAVHSDLPKTKLGLEMAKVKENFARVLQDTLSNPADSKYFQVCISKDSKRLGDPYHKKVSSEVNLQVWFLGI
jgi:hypothetical protein